MSTPRLLWHIAVNELRITMRGWHTLLVVLFPLALYPAMLWAAAEFAVYETARQEAESLRVVVSGELPPELSAPPFEVVQGDEVSLAAGAADLIAQGTPKGEQLQVTLQYQGTRPRSSRARKAAQEVLDELRDARRDVWVAKLPDAPPETWTVASDAADDEVTSALGLLGAMVGYTAVLMMGLGCSYPAVSMVVGERESQTLETLLLASTPRWMLLFGKVLAGALIAAGTACAHAIALSLTMLQLAASAAEQVGEQLEGLDLPLSAVVQTLAAPLARMVVLVGPAMVSTALFASAIMMLVVTPARTFKEAEVLVSTALIGFLLPAGGAVVLSMSGEPPPLWWLPLANLVELVRLAGLGELDMLHALGVALYNCLWLVGVVVALGSLVSGEAYLTQGRLPGWLAKLQRETT